MKVLCVSILVIAAVSARSALQQDIYFRLPECPIDDPLNIVHAAINVTFDPVFKLLVGSSVENFVLRGLRELRYRVEMRSWNGSILTLEVDIIIARVTGDGSYIAEGYLDLHPITQETFPSGNLTGSGLAHFSATNVKILANLDMYLNPQGKVEFSRLELEKVSFDTLEMDLGPDFLIGDEPVDWPEFNRNFKSNFYRDLNENRKVIEERLLEANNILFAKFSLQDLIEPPIGYPPIMCPL